MSEPISLTPKHYGAFVLDKELQQHHFDYLYAFCGMPRARLDAVRAACEDDELRYGVELPIGDDGLYYTGDLSAVAINLKDSDHHPMFSTLLCPYTPTKTELNFVFTPKIDGAEAYATWLRFLIVKFLRPWGYVVTGTALFVFPIRPWETFAVSVTYNNGESIVETTHLSQADSFEVLLLEEMVQQPEIQATAA